MTQEVLFEIVGKSGVITLNRPEALNALTLNMVRLMKPVLADWAVNDAVAHIVIEGAGLLLFLQLQMYMHDHHKNHFLEHHNQ